MLSPIDLPSVSEAVYTQLKQRILHQELLSGQKLNLRHLESQLDVSRTPLKSALARLQVEGLVEIHPRRGTYIAEFTRQDLQECFELRIALEAYCLRFAFASHNRKNLKHVIDFLEALDAFLPPEEKWLEQIADYLERDRQLHLQIIDFAGNQRIKQAYERANVQGYLAIMGTKFLYTDVLQTQSEHRKIAEALRSEDLPLLLTVAREHLEKAGERAIHRLSAQTAEES